MDITPPKHVMRTSELHNLYLLNVRRSGALGGPLGLDLIINGDRCTFATDRIDTRCPAVNPAHNVVEVAVLRKQFDHGPRAQLSHSIQNREIPSKINPAIESDMATNSWV
jgi:hypothetical protein